MNFNLSEDQLLIQQSIERYLDDHYAFSRRQEYLRSANGFSPEIWQEAAKLGWATQVCDLDGLSTAQELMVFFETAGKYLVQEPYLESWVMVAGLLKRLVEREKPSGLNLPTLLEQVLSNQKLGVLAHVENDNPGFHGTMSTTVEKTSEGYALTGEKNVVVYGHLADVLLLTAMLEGEPALFLLNGESLKQAPARTYPTLDNRMATDFTFQHFRIPEAALLCRGEAVGEMLASLWCDAYLAMSAFMVGGMKSLLEMTVQYSQSRRQFGSAIGNFQVIQHMIADMYVAYELARSLVMAAAIKLSEQSDDATACLLAAKVKADEAALWIAEQAVQIHGGMGTTDELAVGHYLKRFMVLTRQFSSPRQLVRDFRQVMNF